MTTRKITKEDNQNMLPTHTRLLNALKMSRFLGVDQKWLRSEALAGRIPCVQAGKQLLFDRDSVEAAILKRARGEDEHGSRS